VYTEACPAKGIYTHSLEAGQDEVSPCNWEGQLNSG